MRYLLPLLSDDDTMTTNDNPAPCWAIALVDPGVGYVAHIARPAANIEDYYAGEGGEQEGEGAGVGGGVSAEWFD
jgi:hypothetical protein